MEVAFDRRFETAKYALNSARILDSRLHPQMINILVEKHWCVDFHAEVTH